jgi:hypothetical protein
MFFFCRIALVFCAAALSLALLADVLFMVAAQLLGGFGIHLNKPYGWVVLLAVWWLLALAIGALVLRKAHIAPF